MWARSIRCCLLAAALLACAGGSFSVRAQVPGLPRPPVRYAGQTIWDLPKTADKEVDVGLWALIIARELDPGVDVQAALDLLDSMAGIIRATLPPGATDWQKLQAVRAFQFDSGSWNGGRPFRYDLVDQVGDSGERMLLTTYLRTRRGNCLTMPALFLALMERVDPEIHLAAAVTPDHIYLRYRDRQTGRRLNVEPSIGGQTLQDRTIAEQVGGVTDLAVANGLWMRDLTRKELVARLLEPLALRAACRRDLGMEESYAMLMNEAAPGLFWTEVALYTATVHIHDYLGEKLRGRRRGEDYPLSFMDDMRWRMLHEALERSIADMTARGYASPGEKVGKIREERRKQEQRGASESADVSSRGGTGR